LILSGKTVGHGFESRYLHKTYIFHIGGILVLTAFKYGKRRGLSPINGKNNGFSVNFGPVANVTVAPKAMVAFA